MKLNGVYSDALVHHLHIALTSHRVTMRASANYHRTDLYYAEISQHTESISHNNYA